jgi:hypothetical protein
VGFLGVYLVLMASRISDQFQHLQRVSLIGFWREALSAQAIKEPNNLLLYQNLAMIYHKIGDFEMRSEPTRRF